MPSTAAGRLFSRFCQLSSDWPDTANPPRCSALTDECVTVLCERKSRGRDVKAGQGGLRPAWPQGPGLNAGPLRDHCPRDLQRFGGQDDPTSGN